MNKGILVFNGSIRRKGTSHIFGKKIMDTVTKRGYASEVVDLIDFVEGKRELDELEDIISRFDIIALSAPLYVDTLPYIDIWFLEKLKEMYAEKLAGKGFFTIVQCAFPYSDMLDIAIETCRYFAEDCNMVWQGGVGYGGGVLIDGRELSSMGKKGTRLASAIANLVSEVLQGEVISSQSKKAIRQDMPKFLSRPIKIFLNKDTVKRCKNKKIGLEEIRSRPYLNS